MRKKKIRRRSRNASIYVLTSALLIIALTVFGISVFLRVMEVYVIGATVYSNEEIIEISGITRGDNILFIDSDAAASRIRAAMPYISEVVIRPSLPSAIRITVTESVAVAAIEHRGEIKLIDSSGRVLQLTDTLPSGLVEIRGFVPLEAEVGSRLRPMSGAETQLRSLTDVLSAMERAGCLEDVSYLDVEHIATISFGYIGRFTVILGGANNVGNKLSQLPVFISQIEARHSEGVTGTINMTTESSDRWTFREDW